MFIKTKNQEKMGGKKIKNSYINIQVNKKQCNP